MNGALDAGGGWKYAFTLVRDLDQWCMLVDQACGWTL